MGGRKRNVPALGRGDGLHDEYSVRLEQAADGVEVLTQVTMPYGLDHLTRDNAVESTRMSEKENDWRVGEEKKKEGKIDT